jgi:hypothetical protein
MTAVLDTVEKNVMHKAQQAMHPRHSCTWRVVVAVCPLHKGLCARFSHRAGIEASDALASGKRPVSRSSSFMSRRAIHAKRASP